MSEKSKGHKEHPADNDQNRPGTYFLPGQIVFHIAGVASPESIQALIDWANSLAQRRGAKISNPRPVQFPPPLEQFPEAKARLAGLFTKYPVGVRSYIPSAYGQQAPFTLVSARVEGVGSPEKLLDLILFLDKKRKCVPKNSLQVVSPNWFMTGTSSTPGSTGGPGGQPTPFTDPADTTRFEFDLSMLPSTFPNLIRDGNQGEGVVVAVLDTAPIQSLDEIYKQWVTKGKPPHSLLSKLLDNTNRRLAVEYDSEVDTPSPLIEPNPPGYIQSNDPGHDYLMSDHGLFVAGIIHSLAPRAGIHLFQVLNRYGVGDLMSIARGLKKVLAMYSTAHLVVNMSLILNLPLEEAHITTDNTAGKQLAEKILRCKPKPSRFKKWICNIMQCIFHRRILGCGESWFERQALPLISICNSVNALDSEIIAAAGNEREKREFRPSARYPAAFPNVWGVGALPKLENPKVNLLTPLETSSYSNFSDKPNGTGIATLGGEEGEEKGILGIYVGEFPKKKDGSQPPNLHGWAWWCGTSFATPIISGMVAALLSNSLPWGTPRDAINSLYGAQAYSTVQNEEVLYVAQK